MEEIKNQFIANAFLSCSLRLEDRKLVNLVANILKHYQILPTGTVGLNHASTNPISVDMKENIIASDIFVLVATKRFLTLDVHKNNISNSISESMQIEIGIAYSSSKPIVVFVEEGTNIGNFLPNITQYITLDGSQANLDSQSFLIYNILKDAIEKSRQIKSNKSWNEFANFTIKALAIYGGFQLLTGEKKTKRKTLVRKNKAKK